MTTVSVLPARPSKQSWVEAKPEGETDSRKVKESESMPISRIQPNNQTAIQGHRASHCTVWLYRSEQKRTKQNGYKTVTAEQETTQRESSVIKTTQQVFTKPTELQKNTNSAKVLSIAEQTRKRVIRLSYLYKRNPTYHTSQLTQRTRQQSRIAPEGKKHNEHYPIKFFENTNTRLQKTEQLLEVDASGKATTKKHDIKLTLEKVEIHAPFNLTPTKKKPYFPGGNWKLDPSAYQKRKLRGDLNESTRKTKHESSAALDKEEQRKGRRETGKRFCPHS